jgi:hypothetical protein
LLGALVAAAIGAMDALLNAAGSERLVRVGICLLVGLLGGLVSGVVLETAHTYLGIPSFLCWIFVGVVIGASLGVYDLLQASSRRQRARAPRKKIINGIVGGLLGGLVGGLLNDMLSLTEDLARFRVALGLVTLGVCIGLLIGLAQVILKEAWLRVDTGFRVGRELMLTKDETTIGRAESCDLGLFSDNNIERLHARIVLKNNAYLLTDAGTPGGTFLNEERVGKPTPLHSGDAIRIGKSVLRFGERQKRKK